MQKSLHKSLLQWPIFFSMLLLGFGLNVQPVFAQERLKDIASVQGIRANQLIGYGLVVGLDGTGDQTTQTPFTVQSITSMLERLGVVLPPGTNLQLKNVAAVMVTTSLPAFAKPGQTLDITVSSMGNAKSLRGGMLLLTPLKGADGQVYAMAQGSLVVSGAGESSGGSKTQINHLSVGRIPAGGTVERAVASPFVLGPTIKFELNETNFTAAQQVVQTINKSEGAGVAAALDGRVIEVMAPSDPNARVAFMARLENLSINTGIDSAKVIINARTGSIVMNRAVTLEPCAIAHGNLSVTITNTPQVSQPNALSGGQTTVTQQADIQIKQEGGQLVMLQGGAKLAEVVKALNMIGATPQDLLAILQAMKAVGALKAELEII
ncbi:MAG: flagellar basal body P-ring protein FlgI [Burkholderiaceae bacterium]|nr:MAG: flagellar basal body P-ring protein FlgI [Burkholderiaceae bacterium]